MAEKLVIDASVAAKWFLDDESDVGLADDILARFLAGDLELHAPRVFRYEVCALLAKACGSRTLTGGRRLTKDDGKEAVRAFSAIDIQLRDLVESAAVAVLEMCIDFSETFKDMSYLHLAEELDCRFCTADSKVHHAVPPSFPTGRVLLLSDWTT